MGKTKIEWTEHSWSPVHGCTKISPGCAHCYAERRARMLAGKAGYPQTPHHFDVVLRPDRLDIPLRRRVPTTYFLPSMGDLFHPDVSDDFICEVFHTMSRCPHHTFQVLTKRAERLPAFFRWAAGSAGASFEWPLLNAWLGVSVENSDYLWRVDELMKCPAAVRFVSAEPLLGPIDFTPYFGGPYCPHCGSRDLQAGRRLSEYRLSCRHCDWGSNSSVWGKRGLDWVIVGGESGPGARPMHPDWARGIRDQCIAAGVLFFMKQWGSAKPNIQLHQHWLDAGWNPGEHRHGRQLDGRTWDEMPNDR